MADVEEGHHDGDSKIISNEPPSATETLCSKVILVFSFILIVCTFPLSLCVCLRMVQVIICILLTGIYFINGSSPIDIFSVNQNVGIRAGSFIQAWKNQSWGPCWPRIVVHRTLHGQNRGA